MTDSSIISKIWNLAGVLRDDGVGYGDYLKQVTYLLLMATYSINLPTAHDCEPASVAVSALSVAEMKKLK